MSAPPAKKAKTGEEEKNEDAKEDVPEEPKAPEELEKDAPALKGAKLKEPVSFLTPDTTLNVLPSSVGNLLSCLSDGGFQHLHAGARANVGLKSGRYVFEAKLVQLMSPVEEQRGSNRAPMPRQLLKIGLSTSSSDLFLGDGAQSICFDSEGSFIYERKKLLAGAKFTRDSVVALVMNLDPKSPNHNTISLFKDGERASQPQKLPTALQGQTLFPTVTYKNSTVHVNFGPTLLAPLPFKCHTVQEAAAADAQIVPCEKPKDGKYDVVMPVGLPDEGSFDWMDTFLDKNPGYTELSDRAILSWAEKSGIWRPKGYQLKSCNDRPEMSFGVSGMDDSSIRRAMYSVAPVQGRNYVIGEVKGNLMKEDRSEVLQLFSSHSFKKTSIVVMGEPPLEIKRKAQEFALRIKQDVVDNEFKQKKTDEMRKRLVEKRKRQLEREKKKRDKALKEKEEEEKKKKEEEEKKANEGKEGEDMKVDEDEKKKEEAEKEKEKEKEKDKEKDEDEEEESEEEKEDNEEPPKAELTPEEKKPWFRKTPVPDIAPYTMNTCFMKFSIPEKSEGFDDVKFEWQKVAKCQDHLKKWMLEKKLCTRIESIKPSEEFNQRMRQWQIIVQQWQGKQSQYRAARERKALEKSKRAAEKAAKEAAKKAKAAAEAKEPKKEDEVEPFPMDEDKEEEDAEEQEEGKVNFDELDVFSVEDVANIGAGEPLFRDFAPEDWSMMSLRYELHLMSHAFRRDADDPERTGIHMDHLSFYYNKYFKKNLNFKAFGFATTEEIVNLIKDAVYVTDAQILESQLPEVLENYGIFAKLTEEDRRFRACRVDMGDESAKLKFSHTSHFQQPAQYQKPHHQQHHKPQGNHHQQIGKGGWGAGYGKGVGKAGNMYSGKRNWKGFQQR